MELQDKIDQQKQLIIKAKATIDKLRLELQDKITQLNSQKERNQELELLVEKYISDEKPRDCQRVLAKIKVEEIEWVCFMSSSEILWLRRSEFDSLLDATLHEKVQQLDYCRSRDDILVLVQQYDTRMKTLQNENTANENKFTELRKQFLELQHENQLIKSDVQNQINELINQSEIVRESCLLYSQEQIRSDCEAKIKYSLIQLQKFCNPSLQTLKSHLILMNQTIYELVRNLCEQNMMFTQQENEHKKQLDQIEEERQLEKQQRQQHFENGRQQIKHLEQLVESQTKELKDKELKIQLIQQDFKQNVNIQYIKNVIIRFFTEEQSVKQKTIPVIGTILQFTEQELQTVTTAWDNQQRSIIGKIFRK